MKHTRIRIACQLAGAVATVSGLILAAILLNPWKKAREVSQLDEIYFGADLIKAVIAALVGLTLAYTLMRVGSCLKSEGRSVPAQRSQLVDDLGSVNEDVCDDEHKEDRGPGKPGK
jgi:hypothetical protein